MENRERDRVSKRTTGTEAGDINRETSERVGREQNSGTSAEFGQGIGRSEYLSEGGEMESKRDRNQSEDLRNKSVGSDSSRQSGSEGFGSSSGRSGSEGYGSSSGRSGSEGYGSSGGRSGSTNRSESIDKSSNRGSSGSMENSNLGNRSSQDEH
jgi:hypothetical protein